MMRIRRDGNVDIESNSGDGESKGECVKMLGDDWIRSEVSCGGEKEEEGPSRYKI